MEYLAERQRQADLAQAFPEADFSGDGFVNPTEEARYNGAVEYIRIGASCKLGAQCLPPTMSPSNPKGPGGGSGGGGSSAGGGSGGGAGSSPSREYRGALGNITGNSMLGYNFGREFGAQLEQLVGAYVDAGRGAAQVQAAIVVAPMSVALTNKYVLALTIMGISHVNYFVNGGGLTVPGSRKGPLGPAPRRVVRPVPMTPIR